MFMWISIVFLPIYLCGFGRCQHGVLCRSLWEARRFSTISGLQSVNCRPVRFSPLVFDRVMMSAKRGSCSSLPCSLQQTKSLWSPICKGKSSSSPLQEKSLQAFSSTDWCWPLLKTTCQKDNVVSEPTGAKRTFCLSPDSYGEIPKVKHWSLQRAGRDYGW